jgi:hypothetical protein
MLTVLVPTRGRPENMSRQMQALKETGSLATVIYAVDADDPRVEEYLERMDHPSAYRFAVLQVGESGKLGEWLNRLAPGISWQVMRSGLNELIGFMGDDHLPRTERWDKKINDAAGDEPSVVYANDLLQGANLPTQVFISASIVHALGYMVPPGAIHLFLDNFWKALGEGSGTLKYCPDVVIEHMHPLVGKAEHDDGYARVNAPEVWAHDEGVFNTWMTLNYGTEMAKIKALKEKT